MTLRLFMTAKQSLARAIGSALAGKTRELQKRDDHFRIAQSDGRVDLVTWCGGHLLEMAPPEFYDERYQKWRLEDLPVIPESWQSREVDPRKRPDLARQLAFIRQSLQQVSVVVHGGDPDREGQWLIDEILNHCQYEGPVQRLLLPSLNWRLLRSAIKNFETTPLDNLQFKSLSISARTRSRIDWLYGMNMTRAYTLLGRHAGYEDVLTVGRVQTPLLGLVVKRDESIEAFTAKDHFSLEAKFRKGEDYCHGLFNSNEITSSDVNNKEALELLAKSLHGAPATLSSREQQHHFESPPLLLDLSTLQIECSEAFGYSAVEVLKIAKRLYEDFHLITYPLTDCRYAPEKSRDEAELVLEVIVENISSHDKNLKHILQNADVWRKSSVWDNSKLTQHHGIMPTAHKIADKKITEQEWKVYEFIVRYYSAQFFPDSETKEDHLIFDVSGYEFNAYKKTIIEKGWKVIIPDESVEKISVHKFPEWFAKDDLLCENLEIRRHKSIPPSRFTEASLISAMKHINSFVEDKNILQQLRLSGGIGTEATRAYMIDGLFKRGYLIKGYKSIYSSGIGRDLIRALPSEAVSVDMAALWEEDLSRMERLSSEEAEKASKNLMNEVQQKVRDYVLQAQQKKNIPVHSPEEILGLQHEQKHHCPRCHSVMQLKNGRYGAFWGCSAYPACDYTARWTD